MNSAETFERVSTTEALRQDLRSESVRGAIYMAVCGGGEFAVRLVSTFILARILIPEHFGLISMVTALTAMAGQFSQLGLSTVTVQRRDINHRQVTNLFWINVALGASLSAIFCFLSPAIASFYRDTRLIPITIAVSTAFLSSGLVVQHEALLTRQMKQAQSAFVRLAASFLSVCLAIGLAVSGFGYWALVWQEVSRGFFTAVGMWIFCPWRPGFPYPREDVRSLLRVGTDLTVTQLFSAVASSVDRMLIGRLFGASPLGMYRQAQQLIMVPIDQLNAPIGSVSQPGLSVLQNDPSRYQRYYEKIVFFVGLLTMPIAAFGAVYAEDLTLLILGDKWINAAPFIRIFAMGAFIRPVSGTIATVLITCGKSRKLLALSFASQSTRLLLMAGGIGWGVKGVAMAEALTPAVLLLPLLYYSFAGTPVTLGTFFRATRTPLLASAVMVVGLILLRSVVHETGPAMSVCLGGAVGGALYLAGCQSLPRGRAEVSALVGDVTASLLRRPPQAVRER